MNRRVFLVFLLISASYAWAAEEYIPRDGDIIFQSSQTAQSRAIELATDSPYSHVGMVFIENGETPVVWEAVGPVKSTGLAEWISKGRNGQFVVKRIKDADDVLTPAAVEKLREEVSRYAGRPYDAQFSWTEDAIYCSELVWKVYDRTLGIQLGGLDRLGDFDLTHPEVQSKMSERYGDAVPLDEPVISPAAIFDSTELEAVYKN